MYIRNRNVLLTLSGPIGRFAFGIGFGLWLFASSSAAESLPRTLDVLLENHCLDCHDDVEMKGGLDLFSLDWNLADPHLADIWVKVHDRLASGEMPPKKKSRLEPEERRKAVSELAASIVSFQDAEATRQGRSVSRRVNRFEYENILRDLLHDPTLKVADQLPLDGEVHGFPKVGSALDVSHVQVDAYLDVAEFALRRALTFTAEKPEPTTNRYYAREQRQMWAGKEIAGTLILPSRWKAWRSMTSILSTNKALTRLKRLSRRKRLPPPFFAEPTPRFTMGLETSKRRSVATTKYA